MKKISLLSVVFLLSACFAIPTPAPTATTAAPYIIVAEDNPYAPKPDDTHLQVAGVLVSSANLLERFDLDPFRVQMSFSGSLPSVCNELRIKIDPPNTKYQIFVEIYSLVNPKLDCDNVFQQFEVSVLLGVYSTGRYTVWVNQGLLGDFVTY